MAAKIVWFEVPAHDTARAREFYGSLLDLQFQSWEGPFEYHTFDGEPGGAIYPSDERGLSVYFGTDDIDAAVARVRELGGDAEDKQPIPGQGWWANCKDPEGNEFRFFQPDESVPADS